MSKEYAIEKDVHIPVAKLWGKSKHEHKWVEIARKMELGDSVLFEDWRDASYLYIALKRIGRKGLQRQVDLKGSIRVWRIP